MGPKIDKTNPYAGDLALIHVDNPVLHALFPQLIFLFSEGLFSIIQDEGYDRAFLNAATRIEPEESLNAQQDVENYAKNRALMLFTVEQQVHATTRRGLRVALPRSGHFNVLSFMSLHCDPGYVPARGRVERPETDVLDLTTLREATAHTGTFYLPHPDSLQDPVALRVWQNIENAESRWRLQAEPMFRELVSQLEAKSNFSNVLDSTDRVAIVGFRHEGQLAFLNNGYAKMIPLDAQRELRNAIRSGTNERWEDILAHVNQHDSWVGLVRLSGINKHPSSLFLSVTQSRDSEGHCIGYTLVFSDFSGEEERIRTRAIRNAERPLHELLGPLEADCQLHANRVGKRVRLEIHGETLRIPERYAPVLLTLPHLLHNAIDHGIERPTERGAKPEIATIKIAAAHNDGVYEFQIADDGSGIHCDDVVQKAVELGLINPDDLPTMSEHEKLELIFHDGLSTAKSISPTSGRGMGMAAVRTAVMQAGGTFQLESTPGNGTRVRIQFAS